MLGRIIVTAVLGEDESTVEIYKGDVTILDGANTVVMELSHTVHLPKGANVRNCCTPFVGLA